MSTRGDAELDAAARILAAIKAVDPGLRMSALALAVDAFVKTDGTIEMVK